jgi:hypothetical protein
MSGMCPKRSLANPNLLQLKDMLRLPTFTAAGMESFKLLTVITYNGKIQKVFYPVLPPDRNADDVLAWVRSESNY